MGKMTDKTPKNESFLRIKVATKRDIPQIQSLQHRSIAELQRGFLNEDQIEASFAGMGLDTQLIEDGTYLCVEDIQTGQLAGCGGWSRRATLYGGNHSKGRNARLLDPETEPARIRAMYTHPDFTRRGVGRLILKTAEAAAAAEGFKRLTMAATKAGRPFYLACGYQIETEFEDMNGGVPVPLYTMTKIINAG
jgi:GNAT superfamily N-acetyltransferase